MRCRLILALLLVAAALSGCGERQTKAEAPSPREVTDTAIGRYCGMSLAEHPGQKGQIFVKGASEPFWFSSVHDTVAFTMLPEEPKEIAAIYVTDMARATSWERPEPGTWIEARSALYVIGSERKGGMGGDEAVPFGDEAAAKRFAAENGGSVVAFAGIPRGYILAEGEKPGDPQTTERPAEPNGGAQDGDAAGRPATDAFHAGRRK